MKKLLMFLCCVFVMNVTDGFAACKLRSCGEKIGSDSVTITGNQCYYCGNCLGAGCCGNNDVVGVLNDKGHTIQLWRCDNTFASGGGTFRDFNPNLICDDSPIQENGIANTKRVIYKPRGEKTKKIEVGDAVWNTGTSFCRYIECEEGYHPDESKKRCASVAEADCIKGDGKWLNGSCSCNHKGSDYKWNGKKCDLTDEAKRRNQQNQQNAQAERQKQEKCNLSGGQWKNGKCDCTVKPNMMSRDNGLTCDCIDGFARNSNKECEITNLEQLKLACDAAIKAGQQAYWSGTQCVCTEPDKKFINGMCVEDVEVAACKAAQEQGIAIWNSGAKTCTCKQTGYVWRNMECVESDELIQEREDSANKSAAASLTMRIRQLNTKIAGKLDGWHKNLNVWKTAEGDFNTARLASDSIAGVVLGTAGGLITSHVVKKGQIKNGFEDINCAIGGQNVAGWHDEFTVGIK